MKSNELSFEEEAHYIRVLRLSIEETKSRFTLDGKGNF